ncbi:MAG TPA: class I SAM-dependent methyltransferase [Candidatus Hydrogenedens sp.]|nr:class I SAM-dependent methyltransferase [Candidatus Hydrogenedens sp.]
MIERQPEPELMDDPLEAEAYSETDFSDVNEKFAAEFSALLPLFGELVMVDLGCGPGDITYRIYQRFEDCKIIGVDGSQSMLQFAQKRFGIRRLQWILGDAKTLPFPSQSIDVIFSNSLLHHLADPKPFWMEIKRILKRGGYIFIRDLFRPESTDKAWEIIETYVSDASKLLQEEYYRSLLSAFIPEEIRKQLEECGLQNLTVKCVTDRHVDICGTLK